MLYVQFDAGSALPGVAPPEGALALIRMRRLRDVIDGLELRKGEPAVAFLRFAALLGLGEGALEVDTWTRRGLDVERGFALTVGRRQWDGRWHLGGAAFACDHDALRSWLASHGLKTRAADDLVVAGTDEAVRMAAPALRAPWRATHTSDDPYLEIIATFGIDRPLGSFWAGACRRDSRFQIEMIMELPGLPPLHMISRDPPTDPSEVLAAEPLVILGHTHPKTAASWAAELASPTAPDAPAPPLPSWDEPGPCDCGIPPDLCAMKQFSLLSSDDGAASALPSADTFRQLSGSLFDLYEVKTSRVGAVHPRDRVVVARSEASRAVLRERDVVFDRAGHVRPLAEGGADVVGPVLLALPWPPLGRPNALRRTFAGLW